MASLKDVKVGDVLYTSHRMVGIRLHKIDRETKTRLVSGSTAFNKSSGLRIGTSGPWNSTYAYPATPEILDRYAKEQAESYIYNNYNKIREESLIEVSEFIKARVTNKG